MDDQTLWKKAHEILFEVEQHPNIEAVYDFRR